MKPIAIAELVSCLYVGISFVAQCFVDDDSASSRRIRMCSALSFVWLLTDGLSFVVTGKVFGSYLPLYILNFGAFTFGSFTMIAFMSYADAFIRERAPLGRWTFRVPIVITAIGAAIIAYQFFTGKIFTFGPDAPKEIGGIPPYVMAVYLMQLFYITAVALAKSRYIGMRAVSVIAVYSVLPAIAVALTAITEQDYSVLAGGIAVNIVAGLLQNNLVNERRKEAEKANRRIKALHQVSRSASWSIVLDERRAIVGCHFSEDLSRVLRNDFGDDGEWIAAIHPDDRDRVVREAQVALDDESGHALFDSEYRVMSGDGVYHWIRSAGQVAFTPGVGGEMYGMCIDVDDAVRSREESRRRLEEALVFTNYFLDTFVSSYSVNLDTHAFRAYRRNEHLERDYPVINDYIESLKAYIAAEVHSDDREALLAFIQPDNLKQALQDRPVVTSRFRSIYGGEEKVYELRVVRGADEHSAAFAFVDASETEAKERERRSLHYLRAFGEMLNAGTWSIDIRGTDEIVGVVWSDEVRRMLGFGGEDDLPNTLEAWSSRLYPEDRERTLAHFWNAVASKSKDLVYDVEYRLRCKSGEYRWYHAYGKLEDNTDGTRRMFGIIVDIMAEKELSGRDARFEVVKEVIHAALWNFKLNARDEVVAVEYSGDLPKLLATDMQPDPDEPLQWMKLVHPDDLPAATTAFKAAIADHSGNTQYDVFYRMVNRDGKYNWYHSAGSVIRHGDGSGDFFGIQIDVTQRIEKEQAQEREIQEAKALEKANKAKSFFFSMVSHDIRTPLNAIIGYAELLKLGMAEEAERQKAVNSVLVSAHTLLELINDVLDLSKLEAGKMEILPEPVDATRLVEEVADAFRATIGGKPVEIRSEVGPMPWLRLDPHRVRQILFNLVGNAVKFTDEGYVAVKAEYVRGENESGTFRFSVADTGCGISEEDQERVAQPYVQVGLEASRGKGTGLGLAICKQLVAKMGGEIELESALGKGTVFTVTIPGVAEEDGARRAQLSTTQRIRLAVDGKAVADMHVLVVDDVVMNQMVLKTMLSRFGITNVETADNGFRALEMLGTSPDFDLVLSDMWMPGMDGERLVREIRKNPDWTKLPVYAVTADVEAQKDYSEMGFTGILLKPLTLEKLKGLIRTAP